MRSLTADAEKRKYYEQVAPVGLRIIHPIK